MTKHRSIYARAFFLLLTQALVALIAVVVVSAASEEPAQLLAASARGVGDPSLFPGTFLATESAPSALLQPTADTTLEVSIVSAPWALLDHNDPTTKGPHVLVVEAAVSNGGATTATLPIITLDYNEDPTNNWVLLTGEDPVRKIAELGPGETYHAYWFATYSTSIGASHVYTVTADADNADPVSTSQNVFRPTADTVETRRALEGGSTRLQETTSDIIVGVIFTATVRWDLGNNFSEVLLSPVGNVDFDPSSYRLVGAQVTLFDGTTPLQTTQDRLYFDTIPLNTTHALGEFSFAALRPKATRICPYTSPLFSSDFKYDNAFCLPGIPIEGTVTLSMTKQVDAAEVQQGQMLTYTIAYTNNGTKSLGNVWIWDDVDPAIGSIITPTLDPPGDPNETTEQRAAWSVGGVAPTGQPGSTGMFTFTIIVDGGGQDLADQTSIVNDAFFGIDPVELPANPALTSTVTSTVQAPTITVAKTDGLSLVKAGEPLTYTLRMTNSGHITASGVVITDLLPSGVSPSGGSSPPWNPDPIPPHGGFEVITVPVTANATNPDGSILTNVMTATYQNEAGWTYDPETATDETTVSAPFWILTKSDDPDSVLAGSTLTYTVSYHHNGTSTAQDVTITDTLPADVTYEGVVSQPPSWDPPLYDSGPPATLTWYAPSLTAGANGTMIFSVTVDSGASGLITNQAVLTSTDPATHTMTTEETTVDTSADLAVGKTDDPDPVLAGENLTYTLQVTNTGPSDVTGVTVTDTLPAEVSFLSADPEQGSFDEATMVWSAGDLASGDSASLTLVVSVDSSATGTISNEAIVSGDQDDPNASNDTATEVTTVNTAADLAVDKSDDPDPVFAGDNLTYTLQVTNTGPSDATGVTLTDTLPAEVSFLFADPDQGSFDDATMVWSAGNLASGDSISLTLVVSVDSSATGTISNEAIVSGDQDDPNSENDTASEETAVNTSADLSINKSDDPDPVAAGGTLTYTLTYTNSGPSDAQNVYITDTLDLNTSFGGVVTQPSGWVALPPDPGAPNTLVWQADAVSAEASDSIVFTVIVNAGTIGAIVNNATITSDTPDDDLSNNDVQERTAVGDPFRATIYGYTFHDANCNGKWDDDEVALARVPINLDGPTSNSSETADDGLYFFITDQPGVYRVLETDPEGFFSTTPNEVHLAVSLGNSYQVDFGDAQGTECAAIYGTVFEDANSNADWDATELGIQDVTITLTDAVATTTNVYGSYTFSTTVAGLYTVVETDLEGYMSTTPNEVEVDVLLGNGYQVDFGDVPFCTCPGDEYEEDDTLELAVELAVEEPQTHNFCDDATDWTYFTAQAGFVYTITTSSWGQRADTYLSLYGIDGQTLLASSDDFEGTDDFSSYITWKIPRGAGGNYYVRTTNRAGLIGCDTGYDIGITQKEGYFILLPLIMHTYTAPGLVEESLTRTESEPDLDMTEEEAPAELKSGFSPTGIITHTCPDAYEVDDTWELAKPIEDGDLQVHSFDSDPVHYAADKDFVWFDIQARRTITFSIPIITGTQTMLELYNPDGSPMEVKTTANQLVWTAPKIGRYFLSVSPHGLATYGCADVAGYKLKAEYEPRWYRYLPTIMRQAGAP